MRTRRRDRPYSDGSLLEQDDAVRDALQLEIVVGGGVIVEHQHGAVAAGEVFLEGEDLPPVSQRIAREQAHLG